MTQLDQCLLERDKKLDRHGDDKNRPCHIPPSNSRRFILSRYSSIGFP